MEVDRMKLELVSPSQTYLFDRQRTGRLKFPLGEEKFPQPLWSFKLRSFPAFSPESTSVFDSSRNQYFGAHDGCFYSLNSNGELRWMFRAGIKVYSSPCLIDDKAVIFASGDAKLYCLSTVDGNPIWVIDLPIAFRTSTTKLLPMIFINLFLYDYAWAQRLKMKTWASPNLSLDSSTLFIVSRGIGLYAFDTQTGNLKWTYKLGQPWNHLTGVAIDMQDRIYAVSQRRFLHCIAPSGDRIWRFDTQTSLDLWGNPSIDLEMSRVYFTGAKGRDEGMAFCVDLSGKEIWRRKLPAATRGGAAIGWSDFITIACANGNLVILSRTDGTVQKVITLADDPSFTLWTTPSIDPNNKIIVPIIENPHLGNVTCLTQEGELLWQLPMGKSHAVPIVDSAGRLYVGSWTGEMRCYATYSKNDHATLV